MNLPLTTRNGWRATPGIHQVEVDRMGIGRQIENPPHFGISYIYDFRREKVIQTESFGHQTRLRGAQHLF